MKKIRVLVIDDSSVVHLLIEKVISSHNDIEIIGEAYDGPEGLDLIYKLSPDIIILDIGMPGMSGLEVLNEIMDKKPTPTIIFSALDKNEVDVGFKALELGAVEIIGKPQSSNLVEFKQKMENSLIKSIRNFADFKVVRRIKNIGTASEKVESEKKTVNVINLKNIPYEEPFPVIVVAASTGGPQTLKTFITDISSRNLRASLVIVQHMAEGFMTGFCEWLSAFSSKPLIFPKNNEIIESGKIYVSPGESHLAFNIEEKFVYLDLPPILGIRPSADILISSQAKIFKERAIAVILTGMGTDGTMGIKDIRSNGGYVIAQDEKSSIIYGMPKSAIESGNVDIISDIKNIGNTIENYCKEWYSKRYK